MNATKQRPKSPTVVDNVSDMQVNTWYINPTKGTSFLGREDEAYVALGLFIPSNSECLVTLVKGGGEKVKMLTFWQLTLQCFPHSDTVSLSSSPVCSESSTQPSSKVSALCLLLSSMKNLQPVLQKTSISLTFHDILADWNVNAVPGSDRVLFHHQKEVRFKIGCSLAVLSKTKKGIEKKKKKICNRMTACKNKIQTQDPNTKRFKRTLIYFNTDTQYVHFRENPLY